MTHYPVLLPVLLVVVAGEAFEGQKFVYEYLALRIERRKVLFLSMSPVWHNDLH